MDRPLKQSEHEHDQPDETAPLTKAAKEKRKGELRLLRPNEAVKLIASHVGGHAAAKARIGFALRDGQIKARARGIHETDEFELSMALASCPRAIKGKKVRRLAASHWKQSINWQEDSGNWQWSDAIFLVTTRESPRSRVVFKGVRFDRSEIKALLKDPELKLPIKRGGGPRPDFEKWKAVWMRLLEAADKGKLREVTSMAELQKLVVDPNSPIAEEYPVDFTEAQIKIKVLNDVFAGFCIPRAT